ncbi:hypothetical protein [Hymenobacter cavernae]|uniref:DUF4240 domain-containing protein n=1 Tax=Hymenobacter cavernae TaxID=2044852 RepID=A0ABQ1TY94_9BACT|nr:hypothetical protein [Hymenobacter cavernae]GGF04329.1 hypothetical protein GCM10011383_14290 [Hymenobacter cavernae]
MQPTDVFQQVLAKAMSVPDFERWVYDTPALELFLSADEYLELISLNYKDKSALYELEKIIGHYVDWGQVRSNELQQLLQIIISRPDSDAVLLALTASYDWYCDGCSFLSDLAFDYGLATEQDFGWEAYKNWKSISEEERQKYLDQFYPGAAQEAARVLEWLASGSIRLHLKSQHDELEYTDNRGSLEQKEPSLLLNSAKRYVPAAPAPASEANRTAQLAKSKKWWQFWK